MAAPRQLSGLLMQALRDLGEEHVTPARREHLERTLPADKRRKAATRCDGSKTEAG
jgi:hypothetical protein